MTQTQPVALDVPVAPLKLIPPEVLAPVAAAQAQGAVELPPETKQRVEAQASAFVTALLTADVNSDAFREKLDAAFSVGRKEIADATTLSNAFTKQSFAADHESAAFKAITEMRELFDELNPAKQGDLLTPTKILGIPVPFMNKLTRYLRRYESAESHMSKLHEQIVATKDMVARGVAALGTEQQKLYASLGKLESAVYFINQVDEQLSAQVEALELSDANRARSLRKEVLYYVRQNVGDVQVAQALVINAYNVAGELRKAGREVITGCDRVATLGIAALSVAVTLAKATGMQIKAMEVVSGAKQSIEGLIVSTGEALNSHVQATTQFASDPILGVQSLQKMFDATFQAMDTMDSFREQALGSMKANNDMLRTQLTTQMQRINNDRQAAGAAITF